MATEEVSIQTGDGSCRTFVFTPQGSAGPWPAVIFCMDGFGIRPTLLDMGRRLADAGFVVLLPDLFYRSGGYDALDPATVFASGSVREILAPLMGSTDNHRAVEDVRAVVDYLDTRDDVAGSKIGTTGYCMGGAISLSIAASFPDRVAAAASFHGGSLATDSDASPHRHVDRITGRVYIAAADRDSSYPPEMAATLVQAMMEGSVDHRHDLYTGAAHGWTMADFPVYDQAAAERHWTELITLLDGALR